MTMDAPARRALVSPATHREFGLADCDQPVHRRFEQQVARAPEAAAVALSAHDVSYATLNAAANRAARTLGAALCGDARPVALLVDQGLDSIVWTLAVLKSGRAFAPLDQRLPEAVLTAMIADLEPGALVAGERYHHLAQGLARSRIPTLGTDAAASAARDPAMSWNLPGEVDPDAVAYVFYTSGSTGTPKGVAGAHRDLLHNVRRYTNTLRFGPGDRLSLVQNPSFSGTKSSLFGALLNGATVAPCDLEDIGVEGLSDWVRGMRVTVFHSVPSIFRQLTDPGGRFPSVRVVRIEGDRASALDVRHFQANFGAGCTLVNGLGATECGLVRQFFVGMRTQVAAGEPLPIGYPVAETTVRVVGADGRELPPRSIGEIVVESRYLAQGYWRQPELTAQRFETLIDGVRRYRTGDLGRMDADGCLTHLGRADHRLRIAGRFVDSDAIEGVLLGVPGVAQAIVGDFVAAAGESKLCAWLVRARGTDATVESLRSALATQPATQGLPVRFVFVEALPLTRDRKVDRARLPSPGRERPELRNEYTAPATDLERQVASIWCEVLELDVVGATDAFLDLGGDSLSAARVAGRLSEVLGARVRVASLFEHATVRALARSLAPDGAAAAPSPAPGPGSRPTPRGHRIAVIGMAGRFPGADDVDAFWSNLRSGRESITFFGADELAAAGVAAPDSALVAARGVLSDVIGFDAPLLGLTPRQAGMLDPQQRLWLESAVRAMEDAGLPVGGAALGRPGPSVGVFTGCRESTYLWDLIGGDRAAVDALLCGIGDDARELLLGNDRDTLATRTSYLLGFTGPSVGVQTACSTSLVAIAQACEALAGGQCDIAVAGGVTVTFPQRRGHGFVAGGIQSRDGHCRAFDAVASGTVFSDGVGAVVLRRLDDAVAAGDRIDAVIRGWAVNNDGPGKASFSAPSVAGQEAVIARAQAHAGVDPREVSYVEAHGTGTPVGDPIEFAALTRAFRRGTDAIGFCALGSVKTNIGHLDSAAGVAGFIKTVLALKHGEIPATLHYRTPNPEIDLAGSPFRVADRLLPWLPEGGRRIAGVTSLGVGGTNCHVIVEEAPASRGEQAEAAAPRVSLVTLSAASDAALAALEANLERYLAGASPAGLAEIASTTQRSRSQHRFRSAIVAASLDEARSALSARNAVGRETPGATPTRTVGPVRPALQVRGKARQGTSPPVAFVFTGQGSQYAGMGRALHAACPEFRRLLEHCDRVLRGHLDRPLLEVMFDAGEDSLRRTDTAQPLLFALEVSLAQLLRGWGIEPRWVIGHSIGEYAAACVAGVFDVDDGLRLAAARGRLMQGLPGQGRMLATLLAPEALQESLAPFGNAVAIAATNSPTQTVLSGDAGVLDRLAGELRSRGIGCRALPVAHAFHSAQMSAVQQPLERLAGTIALRRPTIRLASNLHGSIVTDEVTKPAYWAAHARETVRFAAGIEALVDDGCSLFLEIGPEPVLAPLVRECVRDGRVDTIVTLRRGEDDWRALLEALAGLYVNGVEIDWAVFQQGRRLPPVRLPPYPFQRTPHWYRGALASGGGPRPGAKGAVWRDRSDPGQGCRGAGDLLEAGHPLLGRRLILPGSDEVRFATTFSQTAPQFLGDHRLFGVSLPPGASHFAMLAQAALEIENPRGDTGASVDDDPGGAPEAAPVACFRFERLHLLRPLLLPDGCVRDIQLICARGREGLGFEIVSADRHAEQDRALAWTSHLTAWGRRVAEAEAAFEGASGAGGAWDLAAVRSRCRTWSSGAEFYSRIWANQGGTGSAFRWIESVWQGECEALCRAACPSTIGDAHRYRLHPGLIEAACQVLHACGSIETRDSIEQGGVTWVPFSVEAFSLFAPQATHDEAWCHALLRDATGGHVEADLTIFSASGDVVARLEGFCLRRITRDAMTGIGDGPPTPHPPARGLASADEGAASGLAPSGAAILDAAHITAYLQRQCAVLSGHPEADVAPGASFIDLGLDSIAAVSLANAIARAFGRTVPVVRILSCVSLAALADAICDEPGGGRASIRSSARAMGHDPRP